MPYIILAMALLLITAGSISSLRVIQGQNTPAALDTGTRATRAWLSYKSALLAYLEKNPGADGSLSLDQIGLATDAGLLAAAGNQIQRGPNAVTLEAWMPLTSDEISDAIRLSNGDKSIGTSTGDRWTTPVFGDMGTLPVSAPAGDVVSVVTLSGSGYP